jgi:hypothetical protein
MENLERVQKLFVDRRARFVRWVGWINGRKSRVKGLLYTAQQHFFEKICKRGEGSAGRWEVFYVYYMVWLLQSIRTLKLQFSSNIYWKIIFLWKLSHLNSCFFALRDKVQLRPN